MRRLLPEMRALARQAEEGLPTIFGNRLRDWPYGRHSPRLLEPLTDIHETKDKYIIEAEMPGVKQSDVKFEQPDSNTLVMRAEVHPSGEGRTSGERYYGMMERYVTLPTPIDPEAVEAELKDGILKVEIPKRESDQKPLQVTWKE